MAPKFMEPAISPAWYKYSVVDPDPNQFRYSATLWIRIPNTDPDPQDKFDAKGVRLKTKIQQSETRLTQKNVQGHLFIF